MMSSPPQVSQGPYKPGSLPPEQRTSFRDSKENLLFLGKALLDDEIEERMIFKCRNPTGMRF